MSDHDGDVRCNPREMTVEEAGEIRRDIDQIYKIKKPDCTFYNACLKQAISGRWAGFSCASCRAYSAPDMFQKELDVLALRALQTASEMVAETGKVDRVRGVKPGADAKRTAPQDDAV